MHDPGFKFDEQKNYYLTESHEHAENVAYMKKDARKRFEHETQKLENDKDIKLLENIYDEFEVNKNKNETVSY